jgi:hypothetical protein
MGTRQKVAGSSPDEVSRLSRKCGILSISQPYRPPRPLTGIGLLFTFFYFYAEDGDCKSPHNSLVTTYQTTRCHEL